MREDDHPTLPTLSPSSAVTPPPPLPLSSSSKRKEDPSDSSLLFGRGARYKFWALAAILLLAFWSMFTGTLTLKWSAGNLSRDDLDSPSRDADLDVLEVEEREKVVKHMWDVYTHSQKVQLPRFWQEAFEAAYEELASDEPDVRGAAVAEIARMSMMRISDLEPLEHEERKNSGQRNLKSQGGAITAKSAR